MDHKLLKPPTGQVPIAYPAEPYAPLPAPVFRTEARQPTAVSQMRDMLVRRRWTLLVAFLSVVGVAAYKISRTPRTYTSAVTILVESGRPPSGGAVPEWGEILGLSGSNTIETELQLLESYRVTEPVVDRFDLHARIRQPAGARPQEVLPGFHAARDAAEAVYSIRKLADGRIEIRTTAPEEAPVGIFEPGRQVSTAGLTFEVPRELPEEEVILAISSFDSAVYGVMDRVGPYLVDNDAALIGISCSAYWPWEAQLLCEGISGSYVTMRNDLERSDAVQSSEFLRKQSETVSTQLAEAEDEVRRYKERHQVVDPGAQASSEVQQFAAVRAQRDQLAAEQAALSGFLAQVERGSGPDRYRQLATYPTFINNPMVGNILKNLLDYENALAKLEERRTEQNPEVIALRERISDLETQLGSMARNYSGALSRQVASLDQTLGRSQGRLAGVPATQVELARLERKAELLNQLYLTIQQRLQGAEISKAVELADVSIIDEAFLPGAPSSPNVRKAMALAVMAGLLFGLGASLVQEFADTRLRRRDDVEREAGLPVLTMVPSVKKRRFVVGREPKRLKKAAASADQPRLIDYYPAGGELVLEAFRSLGADLSFAAQSALAAGARTVVFTSPWRGEGKTFSAVNFAATRALQGHRTLLIDADLRAGAAGAALGLDRSPGLSEVLSGRARMLDVIRMVKVGEHRLAVLGSGALQADSGNLLANEELEEVLATAAANFEQVVIDTPPLNLVSDAAAFAARADAVMVVVRSGRTEREALDMTLSRLGRVGARNVGIVLNDVRLPDRDYVARYDYAESQTAS